MDSLSQMLDEAKRTHSDVNILIKALNDGENPTEELVERLEIQLKTMFVLLNSYKRRNPKLQIRPEGQPPDEDGQQHRHDELGL